MFIRRILFAIATLPLALMGALLAQESKSPTPGRDVVTGKAAFADFSQEKPGIFRKITLADLPQPFATESAFNMPSVVARPEGAWPKALPGFKVDLYASKLDNPRLIRTAPNGDLFLAESSSGKIKVFRGIGKNGQAEQTEVFATGLDQPFGIAFYPPGPNPQWVYVGNTGSVVRFPYHEGDMKARRATSSSPATARRCTSPWVRAPTTTTLTTILAKPGAPTSSSSTPTAPGAASMLTASATV